MAIIENINVLINAYNKMFYARSKIDGYNEITVASYQYLFAISDHKRITVTKLSEIVNVKKASVTQMIDSLMRKDYVKKVKSINDKRSSLIELTDKGRMIVESEDSIYRSFMQRIGKSLTSQELEQLDNILTKLTKEIKNFNFE